MSNSDVLDLGKFESIDIMYNSLHVCLIKFSKINRDSLAKWKSERKTGQVFIIIIIIIMIIILPIQLLFADNVLSIGNCPITSVMDLIEFSDTSNVRNVLGRLLISGGS